MNCESGSDFQLIWQKLINEFNIGDNDWLKRLYELKEKWCPAFNLDVLSGNIKSSQRSESTNRIYNKIVGKRLTLTEFANQYKARVKELCDTESCDDYKTRGRPKMLINKCGILSHAAEI